MKAQNSTMICSHSSWSVALKVGVVMGAVGVVLYTSPLLQWVWSCIPALYCSGCGPVYQPSIVVGVVLYRASFVSILAY